MIEILKALKYLYKCRVSVDESKDYKQGFAKCVNIVQYMFESTDQYDLEYRVRELQDTIDKFKSKHVNDICVVEDAERQRDEAYAKIASISSLESSRIKSLMKRAARWRIYYMLRNDNLTSRGRVEVLQELTKNWNE